MEECHPCSEKLCVELEHNGSHLQVVQHGILSKCWATGINAPQQRAKALLLQVPFRRVNLTNGDHFDKYDTTGPQVRPDAGCFQSDRFVFQPLITPQTVASCAGA